MKNQKNNEKYQYLLFGVLLGAVGYYYYNKEKSPTGTGGSESLPATTGGCGCRASALMITPMMAGLAPTRI